MARVTSHSSRGNRLTFMISKGIDEADIRKDIGAELGDFTCEYV